MAVSKVDVRNFFFAVFMILVVSLLSANLAVSLVLLNKRAFVSLESTTKPSITVSATPSAVPVVSKKSNLKTIKGMNCQPTGSNGSMDCQEYQYTYDPNSKTTDTPLPSDMLQAPLQPLP